MRLLRLDSRGELSFNEYQDKDAPCYAILSHTWGPDDTEVTFSDLKDGSGQNKAGYDKIRFCGQQGRKDDLEHFWVDTCCIDKASHAELAEAIASMFRWYQNAAKCYVYLPDVSIQQCKRDQAAPEWKASFRASRWFTRGWTLQELLAPSSVDFFSQEGTRLGDRNTLEQDIHETTGIPVEALRGAPLSGFPTEERMRWAAQRNTKRPEDKAYCLLGIFNVFMLPIYGEGDNAFNRLKDEITKDSRDSFHCKEQLLKCISDGNPFTRSNNIPKCSEGTFEWIFGDQPSDGSHPGDSSSDDGPPRPETRLREWLRHGKGVFWVIGKPGSGKSTFMKFLAGSDNYNPRTMQCLESWAGPKSPRIVSFYFWLADASGMQNSYRGFLCYLLYQLLAERSSYFVSSLLAVNPYRRHRRLVDWDPEQLEALLLDVAGSVAPETPLCFFIDALDECTASDVDRVVAAIKVLSLRADVKIKFCVSSRPEQKLYNRLESLVCSELELHHLTNRDIKRYVTREFENCWPYDTSSPTAEQKQQLIDEVVWSSEGVFLWAFLVTRKLCESLEMGDNIGQLQKQLIELPRDMMQLYESMLKKSTAIEGDRMDEAASYFKFVINYTSGNGPRHRHDYCGRSALQIIVPFYEHFHGKTQPENVPTILDTVRRRINVLCAGLVVVTESYFHNDGLDFFHRTAKDFFRESYAQEILKHSSITQLEYYRLYLDGFIGDGHAGCSVELDLGDAYIMISQIDDIEGLSKADRFQALHYVYEACSRVFAATYDISNHDWVYYLARSPFGRQDEDDQMLDFVAVTIRAETVDLLFHTLLTNASLNQRYKDYLLLCLSRQDLQLSWTHELLKLGANPNAKFYWGLHDRLKISPWLQYLLYANRGYFYGDAEMDADTVNAFLDSGASLHDRTVLLKSLSHDGDALYPHQLRELPRLQKPLFTTKMYLVIEVNAKYLLEEQIKFSSGSMAGFSRPDLQETQPYRQVLLVRPGWSFELLIDDRDGRLRDSSEFLPQLFSEVDVSDSERLLDGMKLYPYIPKRGRYFGYVHSDEICALVKKEIPEIWERSSKVEIEYYLEQRGYYKQADDPAVEQGPIPMF